MKFRYETVTPDHWGDIEQLFGANGACAGCWCMWWRRERGERWEDTQGAVNKRRFRKQVRDGAVHAVLAYDGHRPVGWATFAPRLDFPGLQRARTLKCDDPGAVWALPCLFVLRGYRGQGVATGLVVAACRAMKRDGARVVEAYPVKRRPKPVPHAFAYTGIDTMFRRLGFRPVGRDTGHRRRMRRRLD